MITKKLFLIFLSFLCPSQPNKRVFHPSTFTFSQPHTHEKKLRVYLVKLKTGRIKNQRRKNVKRCLDWMWNGGENDRS